MTTQTTPPCVHSFVKEDCPSCLEGAAIRAKAQTTKECFKHNRRVPNGADCPLCHDAGLPTSNDDFFKRMLDYARTGQNHLGFLIKLEVDNELYDQTMQKIVYKAFCAGVEYGRANP